MLCASPQARPMRALGEPSEKSVKMCASKENDSNTFVIEAWMAGQCWWRTQKHSWHGCGIAVLSTINYSPLGADGDHDHDYEDDDHNDCHHCCRRKLIAPALMLLLLLLLELPLPLPPAPAARAPPDPTPPARCSSCSCHPLRLRRSTATCHLHQHSHQPGSGPQERSTDFGPRASVSRPPARVPSLSNFSYFCYLGT